ncbi:MAG TPA: hypothetical protein PLN05_02855 [Pyrinomonadaceae bacterium]|nr:hypothetical protein [Blastocatellia bacterium]HRJ88379.1 hypothetical protein [Pyrinomonadaceae bacterium]HRK49357.1 hypothetical protein [Pyrinomonadaceae bacterium]
MKTLIFVTVITASLLSLACSGGSTNTSPNTATANKAPANSTAANNAAPPAKADEVPASVKAALPGAQTFTAMHKELTDAQIASIEKDTGGKVTEKDHHSYPGFSTVNGTKTQLGSVTIVKAAGKEIIVVYENKEGSPSIKEIKAEGVPAGFLNQFAGKGHDDDLLLGADIKANGAKDDVAKAITDAVRIDVLSMQALYGKAHSH